MKKRQNFSAAGRCTCSAHKHVVEAYFENIRSTMGPNTKTKNMEPATKKIAKLSPINSSVFRILFNLKWIRAQTKDITESVCFLRQPRIGGNPSLSSINN